MQIPLIGGAYEARSVIANAQRCVNYFPEANRSDSPTPFTLYQRPGRRFLTDPPVAGTGRCLYRASNGNLYAVVGNNVYRITSGYNWTLLGALTAVLVSQVVMADNGIEIMIVDGSSSGYTINMTTDVFATIIDPTGAFTGSTQVEFIDTFLIFNYPGTYNFGSTLSNTITFDALYIAGKAGYPDPLIAMNVNHREILLLGALKSEIWYNAGGASFPFALLPGAYIEHGCLAQYSVASYDLETYWIAQDFQGDCMVLRLRGYDVTRISNHALEYTMQQMKAAGASIEDAVAFTYQQNGHVFYQINFISGNQTWVFDASLGADPTLAWHEETWNNPVSGPERMRDGAMAFAYGKNLSLDYVTGDLYELDQNLYVDQIAGVDCPIVCVRGFPHLAQAMSRTTGQPTNLDGKRIQVSNVRLDFDAGLAVDPNSTISLRWSWDRGHTYGNAVLQPAGNPGQYKTQPLWTQLGTEGRDCILEVSHQINGPAALQGAWADVTVMNM
jgi:hypothetical protein